MSCSPPETRTAICRDCIRELGLAVPPGHPLLCTEWQAVWCAVHGDCTCEYDPPGVCPLHDETSSHPGEMCVLC